MLTTKNTYGYNALHTLIMNKHYEAAMHIIQVSDVNQCSNKNESPLELAIIYLPCIVKTLIENKADINKINNKGLSPLMEALYNKKYDIADYLIDKNVDLKQVDKKNTPLMCASFYKKRDLCIKLLEKGANMYDKNEDTEYGLFVYEGNCAISIDILKNNCLLLDIFIKYGFDVNEPLGNTYPLILAMCYKKSKSVEILLSLDAHICINSDKLLLYAIKLGNNKILKLIQNKLDDDQKYI